MFILNFFYQLSQICHNIQLLDISFYGVISDGLADLISVQQNLKLLRLDNCLTTDITNSLAKLPNTLIELKLYIDNKYGAELHKPLSFIIRFTQLQKMIISSDRLDAFEDFKTLQHAIFSQLQVLKFQYECPRNELLIRFLENNGKNLKEFYINYNISNSLNSAIAKFCPDLRKLFTSFKKDELEMLKMILSNCQYLESIKFRCCGDYLNEKEIFDVVAKYSPKNLYELKLSYSEDIKSELLPEELESFFISWANRTPQKSLSLFSIYNESVGSLDKIDGNKEIIEKYAELGIIKEFKIAEYDEFDDFYGDYYIKLY